MIHDGNSATYLPFRHQIFAMATPGSIEFYHPYTIAFKDFFLEIGVCQFHDIRPGPVHPVYGIDKVGLVSLRGPFHFHPSTTVVITMSKAVG